MYRLVDVEPIDSDSSTDLGAWPRFAASPGARREATRPRQGNDPSAVVVCGGRRRHDLDDRMSNSASEAPSISSRASQSSSTQRVALSSCGSQGVSVWKVCASSDKTCAPDLNHLDEDALGPKASIGTVLSSTTAGSRESVRRQSSGSLLSTCLAPADNSFWGRDGEEKIGSDAEKFSGRHGSKGSSTGVRATSSKFQQEANSIGCSSAQTLIEEVADADPFSPSDRSWAGELQRMHGQPTTLEVPKLRLSRGNRGFSSQPPADMVFAPPPTAVQDVPVPVGPGHDPVPWPLHGYASSGCSS